LRSCVGEFTAEAEAARELGHEVAKVQLHLAVGRGDHGAPAVDDLQKRRVCRGVGRDPGVLDARPSQQLRRPSIGELPEPGRRRPRERLRRRRQPLLECPCHVDAREQLVDQVGAESVLDLLVREQLLARGSPVLGVERLAVDPHREGTDERDERREDEQGRHQKAVIPHVTKPLARADRQQGGQPVSSQGVSTKLGTRRVAERVVHHERACDAIV
jgi:hypothetical protein